MRGRAPALLTVQVDAAAIMSLTSRTLTDALLATRLPEDDIRRRLLAVHRGLLDTSQHVREANFRAIHHADLEWLLRAYDDRFFDGLIQLALNGAQLRFRLSTRMTHAGGKTTTSRSASGDVRYEIAISCGLLFDGFGAQDRAISVCGVECLTRLDALQRIVEHELVHLMEQLCWKTSDCSAARFQDVAAGFFLHRSNQHQMITRHERAAAVGIQVGSMVTFVFEGRQLTGRVNRVTKHATVLVEDPAGQPFRNGLRYLTYYVPVNALKPATQDSRAAAGRMKRVASPTARTL